MSNTISGDSQPLDAYIPVTTTEADATQSAEQMAKVQSNNANFKDGVSVARDGTAGSAGAAAASAPNLPAPGAESASAGNKWMAPSFLVEFLTVMEEVIKEKKGAHLLEGQTKVKGMEATQALGDSEAALIMSKGIKEAGQHLISAAISAGSAVGSASNLAQRAKMKGKRDKIMDNAQQSGDKTATMSPSEANAHKAQGDRIQTLEARQNQQAASSQQQGAQQTRLTDKEQAELSRLKGKQAKLEQKAERRDLDRIDQDMRILDGKAQMYQQVAGALDGLNKSAGTLLTTMDEKELAEVKTQQDINRQFTQSSSEGAKTAADDIAAAVQAMQKAQEQNTQSFRYTSG